MTSIHYNLIDCSSCLFLALFSLNISQLAPVTQKDTKPTKKNINQNPIVRMVKKSKKPKYCENSNMFSGIFECYDKCRLYIFSQQ